MDDDRAFMMLVLCNAQGELSPLEIGMHALTAVPKRAGEENAVGLRAMQERLRRINLR